MIGSETTRIHWRSIVDASTGKARIFMHGTVAPTWTEAKTPDGVPRRKKRRQKPAKISATTTKLIKTTRSEIRRRSQATPNRTFGNPFAATSKPIAARKYSIKQNP